MKSFFVGLDTHERGLRLRADFIDVMRLDVVRVGFVVADVRGKGVPAGMVMMSVRTLVRGGVIGLGDPALVLSEVNALMSQNNPLSMFVTVFFCVLDPVSGNVVYANAGHPSPPLVRSDCSSAFLGTRANAALGIVPDQQYLLGSCSLELGNLLFMYSRIVQLGGVSTKTVTADVPD